MLAKLLTLSLLGLATLSAAQVAEVVTLSDDIENEQVVRVNVTDSYKTVEARLLNNVPLRRGPSYLVPAGRCNVTLTSRELCGTGLVLASLEVTVLNPARRYADIVFEIRDHHRVRVELPRPCSRDWLLDLRLACLRRKLSRSHVRVPLDV